jgi:hypothetical protein
MRWVIVLMIGCLAACATMKNDTTVCEEYRELRCMTDTECSMDSTRGCKVCRCASALEPERPERPDESNDPSGQTR